MKSTKRTPIQLYLVLIIAGLFTLLLWPSLVAAMPLTAKNQLERAWQLAAEVAGYTYQTTAIQTTLPRHGWKTLAVKPKPSDWR